jgi:hypothetical protein
MQNYEVYSLETAATSRFGLLREAERRLLLTVPTGEWTFAGQSEDLAAAENDPQHAESWGEEREVRIALLRWLCVDPSARATVSPEGVRLAGARFDNRLILSFVTLPFPLRFSGCYFPKGISIEGTALPTLTLRRCWIGPFKPSAAPGEVLVHASNLQVQGNLDLAQLRAVGQLRLYGAEVGRNLNCEGASLKNAGGLALTCEQAKIGGAGLLRFGFSSEGEVRLLRATVGSNLECDRASFENPGGRALQCEAAKIASSLFPVGGVTCR